MGRRPASKSSSAIGKAPKGKPSKSAPSREPPAIWSEQNVKDLVEYLVKMKAQAGDGASFKKATFAAAAAHLAGLPYAGPAKTGNACKNKWGRLKREFWAVKELKRASGFSYNETDGAGITAETERVWDAFIKQHPDAKPFKNKGWPYYDVMLKIMPVKAKGSHVFRPAHGGRDGIDSETGGVDGLEDQAEDQVEEEDEDEEIDQLDGSEDIVGSVDGGDREDLEDEDLASSASSASSEDESEGDVAASRHALDTPVSSQKRKPPTTPRTSSTKKPRTSQGVTALNGVENQLDSLNGLLRIMAAEAGGSGPSSQAVPLTPQRKQIAMQRAERLEKHLPVTKMVALLNLFERDVAAADAYLVIKGEELRKAWVDNKLDSF